MRVLIEGWESGEPVRALLDAPDAPQVRAAERVTLRFDTVTAGASMSGMDGDDDGDDNADKSPPLSLLLVQQPHLLARSPPLLSAVVWDCGLALAEWIVEKEAPKAKDGGLTIVELGAGAGAPGLAAAASGLARAVLLTDVQQALRGLVTNVTRNRLRGKVAVAELDWKSRSRDSGNFDVAAASSGLFSSSGSPTPDLILSADVCYPPPPGKSNTTGEDEASSVAEASAVAWAEAAASLCGAWTRVLVAFEARPGGVPTPEFLRSILLREARARFETIEKMDASGLAFAGAANLELYELSGCKK